MASTRIELLKVQLDSEIKQLEIIQRDALPDGSLGNLETDYLDSLSRISKVCQDISAAKGRSLEANGPKERSAAVKHFFIRYRIPIAVGLGLFALSVLKEKNVLDRSWLKCLVETGNEVRDNALLIKEISNSFN